MHCVKSASQRCLSLMWQYASQTCAPSDCADHQRRGWLVSTKYVTNIQHAYVLSHWAESVCVKRGWLKQIGHWDLECVQERLCVRGLQSSSWGLQLLEILCSRSAVRGRDSKLDFVLSSGTTTRDLPHWQKAPAGPPRPGEPPLHIPKRLLYHNYTQNSFWLLRLKSFLSFLTIV